MRFVEALKMMKAGYSMKRPSWGGFWRWDAEKKTIMIHCREQDSDTGKQVFDIRETQRLEYTLSHILEDDWTVANEDNCSLMGGTPTFGFGDAIKHLKRGMKLSRLGWNGKSQYIELATHISFHDPDGGIVNPDHKNIGNNAIAFVGTSGVQIGWLASQADMLADDWTFFN